MKARALARAHAIIERIASGIFTESHPALAQTRAVIEKLHSELSD